jgi:hypothetical protein
MHINQTKKREMARFYKNLLEPMGFTVIPKDEIKEKNPEPAWVPEDKAEYEAMNSAQIAKKLKALSEREEQLKRQMDEVRKKAIEHLNNKEPNDLTSPLYTGTYGKNVVPGNVISVSSDELIDVQNLTKYLNQLKQNKQQKELSDELSDAIKIKSAEVVRPIGGAIHLEISL